MSKNHASLTDDMALFRQTIGHIKKMKHDTVVHSKIAISRQKAAELRRKQNEIHCAFYFSDEYHPLLEEDPIRYKREDISSYELKKLRRGNHHPEIFLDLHGLTQAQAKQEIAALLTVCLKQRIYCTCIMYGHGKNILKKQTPRWLAQHPHVLCFHQAPKEYGGSAALLILMDIKERNKKSGK